MSMIRAIDISYSYNNMPLFDRASFSVGDSMKVGLVGPNGAGKSTLFNLISGKDNLDAGKLEVQGTVGVVPQEIKYDPIMEVSNSVREYIDSENHYEDYELKKILNGLELTSLELNSSSQYLSGGQKTRLAIARALLMEPDILLLDEPTNFLDVEGKKWIMNFLSKYPKTLIVISHDLELMNKYTDKIIAINIQTKKIEEYKGNYDLYIKQKKERDDLLKRQIETQRKHILHMKDGLKNMQRYTSEKGVRQRTQLKQRIQKLEEKLPDPPQELRKIKLKLPQPERVGELPIIIRNISKSFGSTQVLSNVSLSIRRGERICLLGPNGVGKSTLIKIIMDLIETDNGEILKDENLKVGYYSQEFENFDMDKTLMETMYMHTDAGESIIRPMLAKFLFPGRKVFQKVKTLSGGEKTRLSIALLLLQNFNVLILDEPTTYLDLLSQRIILEALKEYKGAMLIVSHTQDFIVELEPTRALILPENKLAIWSNELLKKVSEI